MDELSKRLIRFRKQLEDQVGEIQDSESPIITNVDWYEDLEGQTTIVVEISNTSWQKYVINLCRKILASLFDDPYVVALIVVPIESIGETKGTFSLTYRGSVNTFFFSYYPDKRLRSNPFTVPIYYRKFIDSLQIIKTEKGISLERADTLWKRLFPAAYEELATQQGIRTFSEKHLATSFRNFLIQNIDLIEDVAKAKNEKLRELLKPQDVAPLPKPLERKIIVSDQEYSIASRIPSAVWISPVVIERRIDAHPFQPKFIEVDKLLSERNDISDIGRKLRRKRGISGGATPLGAKYVDESTGVRFIRTQNVTPNWIDLTDLVYISHSDHQALERSALEKKDVLLTITGALFGQSATVYSECLPANISQHSVRMHFLNDLAPRFVSTYLNGKYGQAQIQMHKVGATRSAIDYEGIREIKLPIPLNSVQNYISTKVFLAEKCRFEADKLWKTSISVLSDAVRLPLHTEYFDQFEIVDLQTNEYRLISKSPMIAWVNQGLIEREIGPQFFQPRRENIINKLRTSGVKLEKLSNLASRKSNRISGEKLQNIPYFIGLASIDTNTGYFQPTLINNSDVIGTSVSFKTGDILFSKLRPYLNKVSICPPDISEACGSTELLIYRAKKDVLAYYIYFVIKSNLGLYQILDLTVGSTLPRVDPEIVDDLLIPLISDDKQILIDNNVRKVFGYLHTADILLKEAQIEVEALIEGSLDTEAIINNHAKVPAWEDLF